MSSASPPRKELLLLVVEVNYTFTFSSFVFSFDTTSHPGLLPDSINHGKGVRASCSSRQTAEVTPFWPRWQPPFNHKNGPGPNPATLTLHVDLGAVDSFPETFLFFSLFSFFFYSPPLLRCIFILPLVQKIIAAAVTAKSSRLTMSFSTLWSVSYASRPINRDVDASTNVKLRRPPRSNFLSDVCKPTVFV